MYIFINYSVIYGIYLWAYSHCSHWVCNGQARFQH